MNKEIDKHISENIGKDRYDELVQELNKLKI